MKEVAICQVQQDDDRGQGVEVKIKQGVHGEGVSTKDVYQDALRWRRDNLKKY